MRLLTLHRKRAGELPGVTGPARVDRRTPSLLKRLRPGDVAVLDHIDLDRATAEALVAARVAAVVDAAPAMSGRYPNLGPGVLVEAGIPLLDNVGPDVFSRVSDGDTVRVDGPALYRGEGAVATGTAQDRETVAAASEQAKAGLATQLEAFAADTTEYVRRERALLLDGVGVPAVATRMAHRHVLLVLPGTADRRSLTRLRGYVRDFDPVLVGVDDGADLMLAARLRPDLIVGDMDALSDVALRSGAELVVHARRDGRAPGLDRLERLGLEGVVFPATGTSEDAALLLADAQEPALVVVAGARATLPELLDRGRAGMASTFMTRLRVGGKLVDVEAVRQLYRPRVATWLILLVLLVAVLAVLFAVAMTPVGQSFVHGADAPWTELLGWARARGLLP